MSNRSLTESERAERRQADRHRLEQAARALLSSDGWQRWVRVRSTNGLSRYSFGNQLLIAMQRPDATYVAGFRAFLKLNRCVRKGERAIRILAPMSVRGGEKEARKGGGRDDGEDPRRTVFRAVSVFDVSQTDALPGMEPVPLDTPSQPIQGDTHAHLLTPLELLAGELGYAVQRQPVDGSADGWCDGRKREIVVNAELSPNAQVRVLVPWRSGRIRGVGMGAGGAYSSVGSTCGVAEPVGRSGAARRARAVRWWGWRRGWRSVPSRRRLLGASGLLCRRCSRVAR